MPNREIACWTRRHSTATPLDRVELDIAARGCEACNERGRVEVVDGRALSYGRVANALLAYRIINSANNATTAMNIAICTAPSSQRSTGWLCIQDSPFAQDVEHNVAA